MDIADQINLIKRGCAEFIGEEDLIKKLQHCEQTGKKLIVKAGFDPTAPDIHLGHTVLLNKLKVLQDLGHRVCFLVGDFTALIGDPTGRNVTRVPLSQEDILINAKTYQVQAFKILDPNKTEILYNSAWLAKMSPVDLIKLASSYTVARMLERDDFHKRFTNQQPIAIHEFLYPLLQGFDSVEMQADLELGGNDQKFNLLMGRELQRHYNKPAQAILTLPLLEGLDGVRKMSKSYNNYIGVTDSPDEMFGKIMSLNDDIMWKYFELLSFKSEDEVKSLHKEVLAGKNPRDAKIILGHEIVARFHDQDAAQKAMENFNNRFTKGQMPENIDEIELDLNQLNTEIKHPQVDGMGLVYLLKFAGLTASTSESMRMIKSGAVKINGEKVVDEKKLIAVDTQEIYQVGKLKFKKIILKK